MHSYNNKNKIKEITQNEFFYVVNDNYDEHIELAIPNYTGMHKELVNLLPILNHVPKILDLGCGTGITASMVLSKFPEANLVGIDLFETMIKHAQKRLSVYNNQISFIKGDYRIVDWDKDFDFCISALALHHILPQEKKIIFKKVFNSLNKNGVFAIIDWTNFNSNLINEASYQNAITFAKINIQNSDIADSWAYHWKNLNIPNTVEEMTKWLKNSGFRHIECVYRYFGLSLIIAEK